MLTEKAGKSPPPRPITHASCDGSNGHLPTQQNDSLAACTHSELNRSAPGEIAGAEPTTSNHGTTLTPGCLDTPFNQHPQVLHQDTHITHHHTTPHNVFLENAATEKRLRVLHLATEDLCDNPSLFSFVLIAQPQNRTPMKNP